MKDSNTDLIFDGYGYGIEEIQPLETASFPFLDESINQTFLISDGQEKEEQTQDYTVETADAPYIPSEYVDPSFELFQRQSEELRNQVTGEQMLSNEVPGWVSPEYGGGGVGGFVYNNTDVNFFSGGGGGSYDANIINTSDNWRLGEITMGVLEQVANGVISGFCFDGSSQGNPVLIRIFDNGVYIGEALTNIFRQDVANAGYGDGFSGFSLQIPASLNDGRDHTITAYKDSQQLQGSIIYNSNTFANAQNTDVQIVLIDPVTTSDPVPVAVNNTTTPTVVNTATTTTPTATTAENQTILGLPVEYALIGGAAIVLLFVLGSSK